MNPVPRLHSRGFRFYPLDMNRIPPPFIGEASCGTAWDDERGEPATWNESLL